MSLIIIMGINWVFGVFVFHEYLLPIIYLFAITTALQVSYSTTYCKSLFYMCICTTSQLIVYRSTIIM